MRRKSPICALAVHNLVAAFHTRARRDHLLAPAFASVVGDSDAEWAAYVRDADVWWTSCIMSRGATPPSVSRRPELQPIQIERWLSIYGDTCTDLFEPEIANALRTYAWRIAASVMPACSSAQRSDSQVALSSSI